MIEKSTENRVPLLSSIIINFNAIKVLWKVINEICFYWSFSICARNLIALAVSKLKTS